MGEKVYRPIMGEGEHLVSSRDNPDRVRGLSRDEDNKNPNIPEWEELDLDDLKSEALSTYEGDYYYSRGNRDDEDDEDDEDEYQLTPEQKEIAQFLGEVAVQFLWGGVKFVGTRFISPWYHNKVLPWVVSKTEKHRARKNKEQRNNDVETTEVEKIESASTPQLEDVFSGYDREYEQLHFELDEKEAVEHLMRLIYHMLGAVNEMRILSNSTIHDKCNSDMDRIEAQKAVDCFWAEAVAVQLNKWLNDSRIKLDLETSRDLFNKTGGGVFLNGEYAPVQVDQVVALLQSSAMKQSQQ